MTHTPSPASSAATCRTTPSPAGTDATAATMVSRAVGQCPPAGAAVPVVLKCRSTAGSACAGPADLAELLERQGTEGRLRLIDWQPGPPGAGGELEAELLLEAEAPAGSVPLGDPPRRAAFALNLLGQPPRAVDLRGLGLRGVTP